MDDDTGRYITTVDGRTLRITEFLSFGFDRTFIASVGKDLYVRAGSDRYRLYTGGRDDNTAQI